MTRHTERYGFIVFLYNKNKNPQRNSIALLEVPGTTLTTRISEDEF